MRATTSVADYFCISQTHNSHDFHEELTANGWERTTLIQIPHAINPEFHGTEYENLPCYLHKKHQLIVFNEFEVGADAPVHHWVDSYAYKVTSAFLDAQAGKLAIKVYEHIDGMPGHYLAAKCRLPVKALAFAGYYQQQAKLGNPHACRHAIYQVIIDGLTAFIPGAAVIELGAPLVDVAQPYYDKVIAALNKPSQSKVTSAFKKLLKFDVEAHRWTTDLCFTHAAYKLNAFKQALHKDMIDIHKTIMGEEGATKLNFNLLPTKPLTTRNFLKTAQSSCLKYANNKNYPEPYRTQYQAYADSYAAQLAALPAQLPDHHPDLQSGGKVWRALEKLGAHQSLLILDSTSQHFKRVNDNLRVKFGEHYTPQIRESLNQLGMHSIGSNANLTNVSLDLRHAVASMRFCLAFQPDNYGNLSNFSLDFSTTKAYAGFSIPDVPHQIGAEFIRQFAFDTNGARVVPECKLTLPYVEALSRKMELSHMVELATLPMNQDARAYIAKRIVEHFNAEEVSSSKKMRVVRDITKKLESLSQEQQEEMKQFGNYLEALSKVDKTFQEKLSTNEALQTKHGLEHFIKSMSPFVNAACDLGMIVVEALNKKLSYDQAVNRVQSHIKKLGYNFKIPFNKVLYRSGQFNENDYFNLFFRSLTKSTGEFFTTKHVDFIFNKYWKSRNSLRMKIDRSWERRDKYKTKLNNYKNKLDNICRQLDGLRYGDFLTLSTVAIQVAGDFSLLGNPAIALAKLCLGLFDFGCKKRIFSLEKEAEVYAAVAVTFKGLLDKAEHELGINQSYLERLDQIVHRLPPGVDPNEIRKILEIQKQENVEEFNKLKEQEQELHNRLGELDMQQLILDSLDCYGRDYQQEAKIEAKIEETNNELGKVEESLKNLLEREEEIETLARSEEYLRPLRIIYRAERMAYEEKFEVDQMEEPEEPEDPNDEKYKAEKAIYDAALLKKEAYLNMMSAQALSIETYNENVMRVTNVRDIATEGLGHIKKIISNTNLFKGKTEKVLVCLDVAMVSADLFADFVIMIDHSVKNFLYLINEEGFNKENLGGYIGPRLYQLFTSARKLLSTGNEEMNQLEAVLEKIGTAQFIREFAINGLKIGAKLTTLGNLLFFGLEAFQSDTQRMIRYFDKLVEQLYEKLELKFAKQSEHLEVIHYDILYLRKLLRAQAPNAHDEATERHAAALSQKTHINNVICTLQKLELDHFGYYKKMHLKTYKKIPDISRFNDLLIAMDTAIDHISDTNQNGFIQALDCPTIFSRYAQNPTFFVPVIANNTFFKNSSELPNIYILHSLMHVFVTHLSHYSRAAVSGEASRLQQKVSEKLIKQYQKYQHYLDYIGSSKNVKKLSSNFKSKFIGIRKALKRIIDLHNQNSRLSKSLAFHQKAFVLGTPYSHTNESDLILLQARDALLSIIDGYKTGQLALGIQRFAALSFFNKRPCAMTNESDAVSNLNLNIFRKMLDWRTIKQVLAKPNSWYGALDYLSPSVTGVGLSIVSTGATFYHDYEDVVNFIKERYSQEHRYPIGSTKKQKKIIDKKLKQELQSIPDLPSGWGKIKLKYEAGLRGYVAGICSGFLGVIEDAYNENKKKKKKLNSSKKVMKPGIIGKFMAKYAFGDMKSPPDFTNDIFIIGDGVTWRMPISLPRKIINEINFLIPMQKLKKLIENSPITSGFKVRLNASNRRFSLQLVVTLQYKNLTYDYAYVDLIEVDELVTALYHKNPYELFMMLLYGAPEEFALGLPAKGSVMLSKDVVCPVDTPFIGVHRLWQVFSNKTFIFEYRNFDNNANAAFTESIKSKKLAIKAKPFFKDFRFQLSSRDLKSLPQALVEYFRSENRILISRSLLFDDSFLNVLSDYHQVYESLLASIVLKTGNKVEIESQRLDFLGIPHPLKLKYLAMKDPNSLMDKLGKIAQEIGKAKSFFNKLNFLLSKQGSMNSHLDALFLFLQRYRVEGLISTLSEDIATYHLEYPKPFIRGNLSFQRCYDPYSTMKVLTYNLQQSEAILAQSLGSSSESGNIIYHNESVVVKNTLLHRMTVGYGDSAFHAIFGAPSVIHFGAYFCHTAYEKRQIFAKKLRSSRKNSLLTEMMYQAIQKMIIKGISIGPVFQAAIEQRADQSNVMITKELVREYLNYVGMSGNNLFPIELEMLAIVFNISIEFTFRNSPEDTILLNNGKSTKVKIHYNGVDHFERVKRNFENLSNKDSKSTINRTNLIKELFFVKKQNSSQPQHKSGLKNNIAKRNYGRFFQLSPKPSYAGKTNSLVLSVRDNADSGSAFYGVLLNWFEGGCWHYGIGLSSDCVIEENDVMKIRKIQISKNPVSNHIARPVENINYVSTNKENIFWRLEHAIEYFSSWLYSKESWNSEHFARLITTNNAISYFVKDRIAGSDGVNHDAQWLFNEYIAKFSAPSQKF